MYLKKELNYNYDSLEPYIDTNTMYIHYNNHYLKYLNTLNKLLENSNLKYSKVDLAINIDEVDINIRGDVLFNLGGVLNHELYFKTMSDKKNNFPIKEIKTAIDGTFGNYKNFKIKFIETANNLKGSGYTFLVLDKNKQLFIVNMSNQDTPYYYGLKPILVLDLWEHAYYLKYKYNRKMYIENWFNIIDFNEVNKIYTNNKKRN